MLDLVITASLFFMTIAFVSAVLLYYVSRRFKTETDERIEKIQQILPMANCGGCGRAGCSAFAEDCVKADKESFALMYCPVGGNEVMQKISNLLGFESCKKIKQFAVIHCQGSCEKSPQTNMYEGIKSCYIENTISAGENGCPNGCLHFGDCIKACKFGAISFSDKTNMPIINLEKCVGCGACVKSCPRKLIELKNYDENGNLIYVACANTQKGAQALKNCKGACIACGKCARLSESFVVENNLAKIIDDKIAGLMGSELEQNCPNKVIVFKQENTKNEK